MGNVIKKRLRRVLRRYKSIFIKIALVAIIAVAIIGGVFIMDSDKNALEYKMQGVTIDWLPNGVKRFKSDIDRQSSRYNIDANFVAILMTLESGGYTKANSGQAHGLLQVTPDTATDIAKKHILVSTEKYDLFDSKTSIEFGVAYIAYLRNTFCEKSKRADSSKCVELVSAGYNGGPGAANLVYTGKGLVEDQTIIYSRNAVNMWLEKSASTSETYKKWLEAGGQSLVDAANSEKLKQ